MVKKLVSVLAVVALGLIAGALFVTRDTEVSDPGLRTSDLPPLIPTRSFYADPRSEFGYVASSDGVYTASEKGSLTGRSIVVRKVATGEQIGEFPIGLSAIRWHPTEPKLRFIFDGHDWEADPFNSAREHWVRTSPVKLSGGWVLNEFATDPDRPVLFWGRESLRGTGHIWRVSQDGLNAEKVAEGNAQTQYWVFDELGEPRLRVDARDASTHTVFRKADGVWEEFIHLNLHDTFEPVFDINSEGKLLARSSRGRDKVALVEFDITTGEETVLVWNPNGDVGRTTALTHDGPPDIIRLGVDTQDRVALTDRGQVFLDVLSQFPQPITLGFTAGTPSGRFVTQAISPQSKSWVYLLVDLDEGTHTVLGEYHFRRFKDYLVQERPVTFTARDGVEIPTILTMPQNRSGPVPFVVYVHGGPAEAVWLGYGHGTQFLVNRGYGVLSVNFRGSTGFGKEFQSKGFREFGRAMQDDISDAANWLVSEGLANTDALAVMGTSYGGYAAAMAMTRDPGLFDAAIVEFPMLDVEFQAKHHPGFWRDGMSHWSRYYGHVEDPKDLALMREYSPVNRVDDMHGPLLVLGGEKDPVTAIQQVRNLEAAAQDAGKDIDVYYFPEAGHGADHWRDQLKRARLIEDFLAQHLGGRSGGFEFVERAPGFID